MNVCNFHETLKSLRKAKGLSQEDLGRNLRLSKAVISKYENGLSYPNYDTLIRLAKFFNVSTDFMLGTNSKHDTIDVSKLTESQKAAVYTMVSEFRKANEHSDL